MVEAAPLGSAVARVNSLAKEQSEWTVVLKKQEVMVRRKKNEGGRVMKNEGTKDRELERIMGRGEMERRGRTGCCGAQRNKRYVSQKGKAYIGVVCTPKDNFFFFCFQPDKKQ